MAETTLKVKLLFGDASEPVDTTLKMNGEGTFVTVEANPETAGTEPVLTGIQIGEKKYRVVDTGTIVEANPTLAGTEAELTGLKVGSTKYKMPAVPTIPNAPTVDGNYKLVVADGTASWVAIE